MVSRFASAREVRISLLSSSLVAYALRQNTTGSLNTAIGVSALYGNTTGQGNTASGFAALVSNTTGGDNTASGADALKGNTQGIDNTASGRGALIYNNTGAYNTASPKPSPTNMADHRSPSVRSIRLRHGSGRARSHQQCAKPAKTSVAAGFCWLGVVSARPEPVLSGSRHKRKPARDAWR
jgi:hypothetical protein